MAENIVFNDGTREKQDIAIKDKKSAASAKKAKKASLLAPIPSKLDPVSIAAIITKNLERAKRYATKMKSPAKETGEETPPNG